MSVTLHATAFFSMAKRGNRLIVKISQTPQDIKLLKQCLDEYGNVLRELQKDKQKLVVFVDASGLRFSLDMKLIKVMQAFFDDLEPVSIEVINRFGMQLKNKHMAKVVNNICKASGSPIPTLVHHDRTELKAYLKQATLQSVNVVAKSIDREVARAQLLVFAETELATVGDT